MRTDPVVSIIYLLLAPVALLAPVELMKLGCQGDTGVTHAGTFHFKFVFDSNSRVKESIFKITTDGRKTSKT